MVNLKHLESVVLTEQRGHMHTLIKNVLYSQFREEQPTEWIQNSKNVDRVNPHDWNPKNYEQIGAQLDKCRRVMFPTRQELVGMMLWLLKTITKMYDEAKGLRLFDDDPNWPTEQFAELGEYAEDNIKQLQHHYKPERPIVADANFAKYGGGIQQVKMLLDLLAQFDMQPQHLELVMVPDQTLESMIDTVHHLHNIRQRVASGPYKTCGWSYLLWIEDFVGDAGMYPGVAMRDPFLKVIDDTLYCNPPMGTDGQRRNESGDNPYLSCPSFSFALDSESVCTGIAKIMIAYNLFGFTELWFTDYRNISWSDLKFHKEEVYGRCNQVERGVILDTRMFFQFLDDINALLGLEPRYAQEEEEELLEREGVEDPSAPPTGNIRSDPNRAVIPVEKPTRSYEEERLGADLWKYLVIGLGVVGIGVMVTD